MKKKTKNVKRECVCGMNKIKKNESTQTTKQVPQTVKTHNTKAKPTNKTSTKSNPKYYSKINEQPFRVKYRTNMNVNNFVVVVEEKI